MIERFFTTEFTAKRQVWTANKSEFSAISSFSGHLQQGADHVYQEHLQFAMTKAFTIWCPVGTDIKEGDRLTAGGKEYDVRLVIDRDIVSDNNKHLQVLVELL